MAFKVDHWHALSKYGTRTCGAGVLALVKSSNVAPDFPSTGECIVCVCEGMGKSGLTYSGSGATKLNPGGPHSPKES